MPAKENFRMTFSLKQNAHRTALCNVAIDRGVIVTVRIRYKVPAFVPQLS